MTVMAAIWRELEDARAQLLEVVQVRVTTDALQGSVTTTPLTPERARTIAPLRAYPDAVGAPGGVDADLAAIHHLREVLVHPADWTDVLREAHGDGLDTDSGSGVRRVWGVPVVN